MPGATNLIGKKMQIITKTAPIFRAVFNTIKTGKIEWWSNQRDEYEVEYGWYFNRPFTLFRKVEEHLGDKHSTTWEYSFYKRYLWQVEWRFCRSEEVDEADEFFAPSEDVWRR